MFNLNLGTSDRALRAAIGLSMLVVFLTLPAGGWQAKVALAAGIFALATSVISMCPFYALFGISTCKRRAKDKSTTLPE
ncbi:DUF2892 domain-containing protein [Rhizobium sp. L1K21]|uniref:YgaP family membrane protein n=1 Tax=Rhizobium sp. L1K21 TaxID=2954933 RepID=UPI0020924430|nr:DUF2892 domain-containing protein [Rhizobium sp. L1K21]MCO6185457.1 DUF2892 domain-containing protein [Rhizobium sp. L1K21]